MGIVNHDIEMVRGKYPAFEISKRESDYIFSGELILNHVYNEVRMTGKFNLEIVVPGDFPLAFPKVRELSNYIDENYSHRYKSGQLCLASDLELKMFFSQDTDICSFIEKYVIPYLYTYRFYEEYGVYPYGERSHGTIGDLEYLCLPLLQLCWRVFRKLVILKIKHREIPKLRICIWKLVKILILR